MTKEKNLSQKSLRVYYDAVLDHYIDTTNYIEDFKPYAKRIDVIVNRFLSYKFDKPGKENQGFKEFFKWFVEAEKKGLHSDNFNSKENQLRYKILRHLVAIKVVLVYPIINPVRMYYRNFKSKRVQSIFGKLIKIGNEPNQITKDELEKLILETTAKYWRAMHGRLISGYGKITPEGIQPIIDEKEFLDQQFKLRLTHVSDIQPVLEFILGLDEVFFSISPDDYIRCHKDGNDRSIRRYFIPLYVQYREKKFGCTDRNFQFMRELFRC